MITLYRALTALLHPVLSLVGSGQAKGGNKLWQGRLGLDKLAPVDLWLHAASMGEVKVIEHLVRHLKQKSASIRIHITTMTRTGFESATESMADVASVSFFPLDTKHSLRRTLDALSPKVTAIAETELWPNLIVEVSRREVPLVQINGRMSERAFRRYKYVRGSMGKLLSRYQRLFFRSEPDLERFVSLGADPESCQVAGDMKFDADPIAKQPEVVQAIREQLGLVDGDFVFVAGSTRPDEEELLVQLHRSLAESHDRFKTVLVPRHLERVPEIKAMLGASGLTFAVLDDSGLHGGNQSIVLVDRMGFLGDLYLSANLAFVGGTLVEIGGHNILEPVWRQTPVLFGPHLENVAEAAEYIQNRNFGARARDIGHLTELVEAFVAGEREFAVKSAAEESSSATAVIGKYLLRVLNDA